MITSVVTGAAGFLGSHLTDRLLAENHHVIGKKLGSSSPAPANATAIP